MSYPSTSTRRSTALPYGQTRAPQAALRTSLTLSAMAVVGTGLAVSGGALAASAAAADADLVGRSCVATGTPSTSAATTLAAASRRRHRGRRRRARPAGDPRRPPRPRPTPPRPTCSPSVAPRPTTRSPAPRTSPTRTRATIARALLAEFGFAESQFGCLDSLWERESHWNPFAENPSSGAYGIPQALPGSKMATVGRRLAHQPGHPDPLGPRLHRGPLRLAVRRLGPQPGPRLVLTRTCYVPGGSSISTSSASSSCSSVSSPRST